MNYNSLAYPLSNKFHSHLSAMVTGLGTTTFTIMIRTSAATAAASSLSAAFSIGLFPPRSSTFRFPL